MNAKIYPSNLSGITEASSLKPLAMRYFALASFCEGQTRIYLKNETEDVTALKDALGDLGVGIYRDKSVYTINPVTEWDGGYKRVGVKSSLPALRFILPLTSAVNGICEFSGAGKLLRNNVTTGMNVLKGVSLDSTVLPMIATGKLNSGNYLIEENFNTQVVSALIMALPLVEGDSQIEFSQKLKKQQAIMIDLTLFAMKGFGVEVERLGTIIKIKGGQKYIAPEKELLVEGDFSTAGYFLALNQLGSSVQVLNLNDQSLQTDKNIVDYLEKFKKQEKTIELKTKTNFIFLLTAIASTKDYETTFTGVKIKEKDEQKFLEFIKMLKMLGATINFDGSTLSVKGGKLNGGIMLDTLQDARVAMSLVVLSSVVQGGITILSVEASMIEQATFLNEFIRLGGNCQVG